MSTSTTRTIVATVTVPADVSDYVVTHTVARALESLGATVLGIPWCPDGDTIAEALREVTDSDLLTVPVLEVLPAPLETWPRVVSPLGIVHTRDLDSEDSDSVAVCGQHLPPYWLPTDAQPTCLHCRN